MSDEAVKICLVIGLPFAFMILLFTVLLLLDHLDGYLGSLAREREARLREERDAMEKSILEAMDEIRERDA